MKYVWKRRSGTFFAHKFNAKPLPGNGNNESNRQMFSRNPGNDITCGVICVYAWKMVKMYINVIIHPSEVNSEPATRHKESRQGF